MFLAAVATGALAAAPGTDPSLLAGLSDRVAVVRVLESRSRMENGSSRRLLTDTQLQVQRDLRGTGPRSIEITQLGGKMDQYEMHVNGDAIFSSGEVAVVFLRCPDPKAADHCTLMGLKDGKLALSKSKGIETVATPSGNEDLKVFAQKMRSAPAAKRRPAEPAHKDTP